MTSTLPTAPNAPSTKAWLLLFSLLINLLLVFQQTQLRPAGSPAATRGPAAAQPPQPFSAQHALLKNSAQPAASPVSATTL